MHFKSRDFDDLLAGPNCTAHLLLPPSMPTAAFPLVSPSKPSVPLIYFRHIVSSNGPDYFFLFVRNFTTPILIRRDIMNNPT